MAKGGFNTPLLLLILFLAGSIGLVVTQGPSKAAWHGYEPLGAYPGQRFHVEFPTAERPQKKLITRESKQWGKFQETTYELDNGDTLYSVIVMPYSPAGIAAKNQNPTEALTTFQTFYCQNVDPAWTATGVTPTTTAAGHHALDYAFTFQNQGKTMGGRARLLLTDSCQFHINAISAVDPEDEDLLRFVESFEPLPDQAAAPPPEAPVAPEAPEAE